MECQFFGIERSSYIKSTYSSKFDSYLTVIGIHIHIMHLTDDEDSGTVATADVMDGGICSVPLSHHSTNPPSPDIYSE